jgi:hypothetical protein
MVCFLKLSAQTQKGNKIILDTVYAKGADPNPQYERYYFQQKTWNRSLNSYRNMSMPFTDKQNRVFIYYRPLEKGLPAKIDTFSTVKSTTIIPDLSNKKLKIQNAYLGVFNKTLQSYSKEGENRRFSISSKKRIISTPISIYNCIVSFNASFDNNIDSMIFNNKITLGNNNFKIFYLNNTVFNDTCEINFKKNLNFFTKKPSLVSGIPKGAKAFFKNTIFNGPFLLANSEELDHLYGDHYNSFFPKTFSIKETEKEREREIFFPLSNIGFKNVTINNSFIIGATSLKNIVFDYVTFNSPLLLTDLKLDSTIFKNCNFNSPLIDLRGVTLFHGASFKNNFFNQNCNLLLRPDDEIEKLTLDNIELQKVFFVVDWGWNNTQVRYVKWDGETKIFGASFFEKYRFKTNEIKADPLRDFSEHDLETVKRKLQKIKDYVNKTVTSDDIFGSDKQRITNWLNYQDKQYEKLYYQKNNRLYYNWLLFLESTVNFGYRGEGAFIRFCLLIIFIFSLIYRIGFKTEIAAYIAKEAVVAVEDTPVNTVRNWSVKKIIQRVFIVDIAFIKSFYLSFTIFFNPIFPSLIFKYSKWFFWLIILEWMIGVLFILLFLYFIAGNYPIVTKLIGLK